MIRKPATWLFAMMLGIPWGSPMAGPGSALACQDAHSVQAVAAQTSSPRAPRAPRAPHAPAPPEPVETPEPAAAPEPPEASLEIPQAPAIMAPRGWFGFGFQCDQCYVKSGPGDSTVVWEFESLPKVYSVDLGGPAARAGLRRGDVIMRIDGHSILSPDGGRRFGATRPGQVVKWTVQRDGQTRTVVARASERPERREREIVNLRRELTRLNELQNLDEMRRQLARLSRELSRRRPQDQTREEQRAKEQSSRRLRYAGVIGGTEVEVRGTGSVIVSESDPKDQLVINTGESVVIIRVADYVRKNKKGETPR